MRRSLLAVAITAGLAIGISLPVGAIGETQVTLNCSDGTSTALVVDANTLAGLTQAVQAMIDYPAGLTCTLVQNPLAGFFGRVALASPGKNPFIVGGGRWKVPCAVLPPPPPCEDPTDPNCGGSVEGGVVARVPGTWSSWRGSSSSATLTADEFFWVNIAVNVHQRDDGSFYGTLNETIPANQSCTDFGPFGPSHFTSKPTCLFVEGTQPSPPVQPLAFVTSEVTQTSGDPFPADDPLTLDVFETVDMTEFVHFGFHDNGNPGHQPREDELNGPPAVPTVDMNRNCTPGEPMPAPEAFDLQHGNISTHP